MSGSDKKEVSDEKTVNVVEVKGTIKRNEDRRKFLNNALKDVEQAEAVDLAIDFDEALKEYTVKNAPHKIKLKGRVFEVPFTMPFSFGMFYMRNCLKKRDNGVFFEIPTDLMSEFLDKMFGKKFLDMLDEEQDVEMNFIVGVLIPEVMSLWGHAVNTEVPEKNV